MNSTIDSPIAVVPGSWDAWLVALRPKTLWVAVVPVFVGTSLAVAETGQVNPLVALLALVASILLQILTNLQNDVGYIPVAWVVRYVAAKPIVRGFEKNKAGEQLVDGNIYVDMLTKLYVVEKG